MNIMYALQKIQTDVSTPIFILLLKKGTTFTEISLRMKFLVFQK